MSTTLLEVVTPERIILSEQVNMVIIRTGGGELGILPRHTALAATVKPGIVRVKFPNGEDFIHTTGGFLQVLPEKITFLADVAELASQIDLERAERAKERAEQRLSQREGIDVARAEMALHRALNRIETAEKSRESGRPVGTR
ncbi:ATP synthase F1 subunit epsilon [Alicyclobacillus mengziensis]|uniref:ATP synthase epsilon chain n=1 Tax=Alicyclobacillus mengziensis TaxID=2931921 RepID=A0A9X7VYV8_9BACL|nr:ATP synthase F1 subunit epsilon [Alicyclobacillus mengziensis]QSO47589.1 ATP synthase F1 subunit epsilon [Alicyclobacillus mengziensis]